MGAEKKVLEEMAAEPGNESPLDIDENDRSSKSSNDRLRPAKV
jgi:hypothetical protein